MKGIDRLIQHWKQPTRIGQTGVLKASARMPDNHQNNADAFGKIDPL